jgi:sensor histidine kinase YesM
MKKLIALILILVISSFVVVSNKPKFFNENQIRQSRESIHSENFKWEYVKERLFDGETEKVYKIKGPILISLKKASKQDSTIVKEIMQELRKIIPNKTIDLYESFVGEPFEINDKKDRFAKVKGINFIELINSTIVMEFDSGLKDSLEHNSQSFVNVDLPDGIGNISSTRKFSKTVHSNSWSSAYTISFNINKYLSHNERKKYIQYEFLRSLCYVNDGNFINETSVNGIAPIFQTAVHQPVNSEFTDRDKFLLQKLYSGNFIERFKDYMYANYPWRYASAFINKKEHEYKVLGVITALGLISFILIFSYFQKRKYKYSFLNYLFPVFLIFLAFFNFSSLYKSLLDYSSIFFWYDFLNQVFLTVVSSLIVSLLLWKFEKICFKGNEKFAYQLVLVVIITFVSFVTPMMLYHFISQEGSDIYNLVSFSYLFFSAGLAIGRGILIYLNHFSDSLVKEKDVELSRLKEAKAEAEVKMLQSQINPHFLYNALNSIASLAHTDANKTEKMALSLSDLFRHSINQKEKKTNTLGDELSLVRNYLEIEQIRFGDRLQFSIDVEPDLLSLEIPMFILQPLVENAIKHGISKIEGLGEIALNIVKKDQGILISVQDNGPDFPEGLVSGHGLQTVYDLLRFSYGDKAEIRCHNQPKKEITIYIDNVSK